MSNILYLGSATISKVEAYLPISGTYSEPCQPFKKEAFAETDDGFQPQTIFAKALP